MLNSMLILLILLQLKHFWLDFWYQPPYMWQNKGTYGHPGGLIHSFFHAVATYFCLEIVLQDALALWPMWICVVEFLIHYHVDWAKMNINKKMGWGATTHNEFWQLTGFDQLLHQLTYVGIIWASFSFK